MDFTYDDGTFLHRIANDGTIESICSTCFVTVSRTWGHFKLTTGELSEIEAAHVCDQKHKPVRRRDSI